jgi:FixJ family two-component response regulator
MPPGAVYIVDDEASVRSALCRLLRAHGFHAESFGTPEAFLATSHPDDVPSCLLVDLCMPGTSGLDLQEQLAGHGLGMAVVFISGRPDVEQSIRAMKRGAVDFLLKPFSSQALLAAVEAALGRDRARLSARAQHDVLSHRFETLSPREREVFDLVVSGLLNKQAAAELGILEGTIKVHRARVMQKMRAGSLAELVRMWDRLGRAPLPSMQPLAPARHSTKVQ